MTRKVFKASSGKGKTAMWSDKSKLDILFGNHGQHSLSSKEEMDHSASSQSKFQKPLSICGSTINAEQQVILFSGKTLHISPRQFKTYAATSGHKK